MPASLGGAYVSWIFAWTSIMGFGDYSPKTQLGRLLMVGWALLALILTATYTANVTP